MRKLKRKFFFETENKELADEMAENLAGLQFQIKEFGSKHFNYRYKRSGGKVGEPKHSIMVEYSFPFPNTYVELSSIKASNDKHVEVQRIQNANAIRMALNEQEIFNLSLPTELGFNNTYQIDMLAHWGFQLTQLQMKDLPCQLCGLKDGRRKSMHLVADVQSVRKEPNSNFDAHVALLACNKCLAEQASKGKPHFLPDEFIPKFIMEGTVIAPVYMTDRESVRYDNIEEA